MSMTDQEQNFMSELMNRAPEVLAMKEIVEEMLARYNQNGFGVSITDEKLASIPTFAHLTQSKMWNSINAYQAFVDSLGDYVSGESVNLIKLKG